MRFSLRKYEKSSCKVAPHHHRQSSSPDLSQMPHTPNGTLAMGDSQNGIESTEFASTDLAGYIQADPRPTFVVTSSTSGSSDGLGVRVHFWNIAFESVNGLFSQLTIAPSFSTISKEIKTHASNFASWLRGENSETSMEFHDFIWTVTNVHDRWRVINGISRPKDHQTIDTSAKVLTSMKSYGTPKHVHEIPGVDLFSMVNAFGATVSQHHHLVQEYDWASTALGPIETWPSLLLQVVPFVLGNPEACCVFWGKDRNLIYNEAYISIIRGFHPKALGSPARDAFAPVWHLFEPVLKQVETYRKTIKQQESPLLVDRGNFLEEIYFTYTWTPLLGQDRHCLGVYLRVIEVTKQTVVQQRMLSLLKLGENVAGVSSLSEFWRLLFLALEDNTSDVPVAALYSAGIDVLLTSFSDDPSSTSHANNTEQWILEGSIGFQQGDANLPSALDVNGNTGFAPAIRTAISSSGPMLFSTNDGSLPEDILHGCEDRGLGTVCSQVVICPLRSSFGDTLGWFILGVNPRRPYDNEYKRFVQLLARHIENSAVPVILLEKEKRRTNNVVARAAYEQQWLAKQLQAQTREAEESELRFLNFAREAPIGVYILNAQGEVTFGNEAWYKLVGVPPGAQESQAWRPYIHPDDVDAVDAEWTRLTQGGTQTNFEWRAVRPNSNEEKNENVKYLRSSAFPELAEDGSLKSVTGILQDLSLERAHEQIQSKQLTSALEAKRAQEYFMDMVSHEMRNPLNAIIQCGEEASELVATLNNQSQSHKSLDPAILKDAAEAIYTILYCGRHQKQIIDDVLTLSKLDSDMLTISPIKVAPVDVVQQVLKVFDSDIRASGITATLDYTLRESDGERVGVFMDPSRVIQILINLVGNAVKFMKDRPVRKLHVRISASKEKPQSVDVRYAPSGRQRPDPTDLPVWGQGDIRYIYFSVHDTGPGLTKDEMDSLFARFRQASPRTHIQYGGSGLGLFISRELAELHGGEVGLSSEVDKGSIFAFYIKARLVIPDMADEARDADMTSETQPPPAKRRKSPTLSHASDMPDLSSPGKGLTVVVVEDNLVNQKVLKRQLLKLGYEVETANHGEEALELLRTSVWWRGENPGTRKLSVILCDLEMPVMDGITCVRKIRELQKDHLLDTNIPVVAVTGNARREQILNAKAAGFDDVVSKPYSVPDLVPLIHRLTH